jgi:hypothetical protein
MKKTLSQEDFVDGFDSCGRGNQFTRAARRWLFDYYIEIEDGGCEEMEYDPIAVCCEWTEYETAKEFIDAFEEHLDGDEEDEDTKVANIKYALERHTTVGETDDDTWLVMNY